MGTNTPRKSTYIAIVVGTVIILSLFAGSVYYGDYRRTYHGDLSWSFEDPRELAKDIITNYQHLEEFYISFSVLDSNYDSVDNIVFVNNNSNFAFQKPSGNYSAQFYNYTDHRNVNKIYLNSSVVLNIVNAMSKEFEIFDTRDVYLTSLFGEKEIKDKEFKPLNDFVSTLRVKYSDNLIISFEIRQGNIVVQFKTSTGPETARYLKYAYWKIQAYEFSYIQLALDPIFDQYNIHNATFLT